MMQSSSSSYKQSLPAVRLDLGRVDHDETVLGQRICDTEDTLSKLLQLYPVQTTEKRHVQGHIAVEFVNIYST